MSHAKLQPETRSSYSPIGGGAINEKKRLYLQQQQQQQQQEQQQQDSKSLLQLGVGKTNFDPQNQPSHLLHAVMGLDRYPNYVSRWNFDVEDVDRLELALEEQLAKVRTQKEQLSTRNRKFQQIKERVLKYMEQNEEYDFRFDIFKPPSTWKEIQENVLHPKASDAILGSKQFCAASSRDVPPTVDDVLQGNIHVELDMHKLSDWMDEECFDVCSFPLLSKSFCAQIVTVIRCFIQQSKLQEDSSLEDLGRIPFDLDSIGLSWVNDLLFQLVIRPLSRHLFATTEQFEDLDWRQGYVAGYSNMPSENKGAQRHRLVAHTDDSEVTLNVGMGDEDFQGGDLVFWNLRGTEREGQYVGEFHPKMGYALLHSGRHLHEVKQVTKGDRYAYIIWARSWKSLRKNTCPCCWMMRRQQSNSVNSSKAKRPHRCISEPLWN